MAIQFFCSSCGQPIEVDDEMANQTVTCPYCRAAAQTPAASDPRVRLSAPPADSAETPAPAPDQVVDAAVIGQPAPQAKSVLGWVALGFIVAAMIAIASTVPTIRGIMSTLPPLGQQPTPEEMEQYQLQFQQALAPHAWVGPVGLLGVCLFPVTSLILAIIALVKRSKPMWPTVVSLVLIALTIVLACGGSVMMQAAQQGGP